MLASLSQIPLLVLVLSRQSISAQAHALPNPQDIANQQPLQPQPPHQHEPPSTSTRELSSHPDLPAITSHTTLTLYTTTKTITVPRTREAMQTSPSSFVEDEDEHEEVDECNPAACAGCRAWYLCQADLGVEW